MKEGRRRKKDTMSGFPTTGSTDAKAQRLGDGIKVAQWVYENL